MKKRLTAVMLVVSLFLSVWMVPASSATLDTTSPYDGQYVIIYNTNKNPGTSQSTGTMNLNTQMFSMQTTEESDMEQPEEDICDIDVIDGQEYYAMEYENPFAPSVEEFCSEFAEELEDGIVDEEIDKPDAKYENEETDDGLLDAGPRMDMSLIEAPISYAVGASRTFKAYDVYLNKYYDLTAIHRYEGQYCDVWVENLSNGVTNTHATQMGQYFDSVIRPTLYTNFGPYFSGDTSSGLHQNGKIIILIQDIRDPYYYQHTLTSPYVAGYFDAADLLTGSSGSGNKTAMIHIDIDPLLLSGSTVVPSRGYRTLVHEFQHLIHYTESCRKGKSDDMWLDEAFSMAAEHLVTGPLPDRISQFNNSATVHLTGAALCYTDYNQNNNDLGANYGLPYLFAQYLRTQTKTYANGGDKIYKLILSTNYTGYQSVWEALEQLGYPDDNSTSNNPITSFDDFHRNFRIALGAQEPTGPFGFDGEDAFEDLIVTLHSGGAAINLKGTAAIIVKQSNPPFTLSGAGSNIKACGFTPTPKPTAPTPTSNKSLTGTTTNVPRGTEIKLSSSLADALILYTTDGSNPITSSTALTFSPSFPIIIMNSGTVIKAATRRRGYTDSAVATFTYNIPTSPYNTEIQTFTASSVSNTSVSLQTFIRGHNQSATTTGYLFYAAYDAENRLVGVTWTVLSVVGYGTYTTPMTITCTSRPVKAKAMYIKNDPTSFEPLTEAITIPLK